MLDFEAEREAYYEKRIGCNVIQFYINEFLDWFISKRRGKKNTYEHYSGGWYSDEMGYPCAVNMAMIDTNMIKNGDIAFQVDNEGNKIGIYTFHRPAQFDNIDLRSICSEEFKQKHKDLFKTMKDCRRETNDE